MRVPFALLICFMAGFVVHWMIGTNMNIYFRDTENVQPTRFMAPRPQTPKCSGSCNCTLSRILDRKFKDLKNSVVVYIYDFPDKFHKTLEDNYRTKTRFDLSYESFGKTVQYEDGIVFRNTYQGTFDMIFHKRLRDTWNITSDPEKADVFFVPYYHDMTVKASVNHGIIKDGDLRKELNKLPYYLAQKPHLLAIGWPMIFAPFSGYAFYGLTLEKAANKNIGKEMLVVPYPSYGHITRPGGSKYAKNLFMHARKVFLFMAVQDRASDGYYAHDFRHQIFTNVTRRTTLPMDEEYKASNMKQMEKMEMINYLPARYTPEVAVAVVDWMYNSIFCLQPPGDSDTRKSFYDAIMCGCIPVIFELDHKVEYPFESIFDYSTFSVKIPRNKHIQFFEVLHTYSWPKIVNLQFNLRCVMQYLQYNDVTAYDAGPDAFTMIMMEVKSRLNITKNNGVH